MIVVVSCLCRGEKCAAHFGPSQTEIPSCSAGCGSSRVTSVCVHVDVTAPSRDLDLRQQLPSLDESFAEPKYRTPSPANFLGDQLYLLTRFHGRFSVVSVCVMFPCPVCWCFVGRDVKLRFCMYLLIRFLSWFTFGCCMCDFLTLSVLFFSFGR